MVAITRAKTYNERGEKVEDFPVLQDNIDPKTCDETLLFTLIETVGGAIWMTRHDIHNGRYELTEDTAQWLEDAQKTIRNLVEQTARFGISPLNPDDTPTEDYDAWYQRMKVEAA